LVLNDFKGYVIAYAFVDLANTEEAHHAIQTLCGRRKLGRTLWIQIARNPDQNAMPKPSVEETVMPTPEVINGTPAPTMQDEGDRKADGAQSAGSGARHVLYVRNLPYAATEPDLEEFFGGFSP
jgi:RNA recognition motif-containing protein